MGQNSLLNATSSLKYILKISVQISLFLCTCPLFFTFLLSHETWEAYQLLYPFEWYHHCISANYLSLGMVSLGRDCHLMYAELPDWVCMAGPRTAKAWLLLIVWNHCFQLDCWQVSRILKWPRKKNVVFLQEDGSGSEQVVVTLLIQVLWRLNMTF